MKYLILMICLGFPLFSCGDGNSSSNAKENKNLKEVVIERYSEGDKKIVGFYDGEGSNEVIVKRVHYYSQNDGGGIMKKENYKNRKLDGENIEYTKNGDPSYIKIYKEGDLTLEYDPVVNENGKIKVTWEEDPEMNGGDGNNDESDDKNNYPDYTPGRDTTKGGNL